MDGDPAKIYRTRLYSFAANEKEGAVELRIYALRWLADPKNKAMKRLIRSCLLAGCLLSLLVNASAQAKKTMKKIDPQKVAQTLEVGQRGFAAFQKGLGTGDWNDFLVLLTDDFSFYFPQGKYQGAHQGKDQAKEFFAYVSRAFPGGIKITEVMHVTAGEDTVVFEFKDEGTLRDAPYKNRVAVSWNIRGDQISGYREYFGSDGKSN